MDVLSVNIYTPRQNLETRDCKNLHLALLDRIKVLSRASKMLKEETGARDPRFFEQGIY